MSFKITRHAGHIAYSASGDSAGILTGTSTLPVKCLSARKAFPQKFYVGFMLFQRENKYTL